MRQATGTFRATWNGAVIAESDDTIVVEGNHYFPRESLDATYLRRSDWHTRCPWKGVASYFDVVVDGKVNRNAAWYYPDPSVAAEPIRDRVAFWHGVRIVQVRDDGSATGTGPLSRLRELLR